MTTYTNTSYVAKSVGITAVSLLTVAGSTTATLTSLVVANTTTSPITNDVYFTRSAVDYYLVKAATVPVGGSLEVMQGNRIVLIAGDVLKVVSSAATSADVIVSVLNAA
jgi:hypothetical protein